MICSNKLYVHWYRNTLLNSVQPTLYYVDHDYYNHYYGDDDGWPMVGDLHLVASGHRETTALKLIVIYVTEIQT